MRKNLAAFTATDGKPYPQYLSINQELGDGSVSFTVREPASPDGAEGRTATTTLTCKEFGELLRQLFGAL